MHDAAGNNQVHLRDVKVGRLAIVDSEFAGPTALFGGKGTDTLRESGSVFKGRFYEDLEV